MKNAVVTMQVDGTDSFITVDIADVDDGNVYFVNIAQHVEGTVIRFDEQVVTKEELLNLKDAIDYIIKSNESE